MKRWLLLFLLSASAMMQAKFYVVDEEDQFDKYVRRHSVSIVHFNPFAPDEDIPKLDRMKRAFKSLADSSRYRDADIAFIGTNIQLVPELADRYDIQLPFMEPNDKQVTDNSEADEDEKNAEAKKGVGEEVITDIEDLPSAQQSTVMIFKRGRALKQKGDFTKLEGFVSKSQLRSFIEENVGDFIDDVLAERQEAMREEQQQMQQRQQQLAQQAQAQQVATTRTVYEVPQTRYVYYPGRTSYYYDRPYWGGYWGRPYWGGYWGRPWRRGWGWGGPGIGFGFGGRRGGFSIGFGW